MRTSAFDNPASVFWEDCAISVSILYSLSFSELLFLLISLTTESNL